MVFKQKTNNRKEPDYGQGASDVTRKELKEPPGIQAAGHSPDPGVHRQNSEKLPALSQFPAAVMLPVLWAGVG